MNNNGLYDEQAFGSQVDRPPSSQHGRPQSRHARDGSDDDYIPQEYEQQQKPIPSSKRLQTPATDSSPESFAPEPLRDEEPTRDEDGPLAPEHFPTEQEFKQIVDDYLQGLSERKREKALITQKMYDNVLLILRDPRNTATSTAQFRFWAKKMFAILEYKGEYVVTHDKRPVAVKEQIYDVLVYCHGQASHGGRDKTSAMTREYYSWVPKQLVAEFVKKCPTCLMNRQKHPNFFGEAHAPVPQSRKPVTFYAEPAPGVPQTITLQDARDAARMGAIPKATGFFTRNDDDDYAYPGGGRRKGSSASAYSSKSLRGPGGKDNRHDRQSFGSSSGAPYDELEAHRREMERRNYLDPELEYRPQSSAGSHHGGFDVNGVPLLDRAGSSSTLNSPAIQTPSYGMYNNQTTGSFPMASYLSLPTGTGDHRLSVPELYAQQQQQNCSNDYSQSMARRGSTGGMMGGDGDQAHNQHQQDMADLLQAHQMQQVASDGGYFGGQFQQQQGNLNINRPVSAGGIPLPVYHSPDRSTTNGGGGIVFNDPFSSLSQSTSQDGSFSQNLPNSTSSGTIHRAHRPPPLNLGLGQQFSVYRSLPLDSAGLESAGLLSAQQMHHAQRAYLYSPNTGGFSPTAGAAHLSLPNTAHGRGGGGSGGGFPDGFGAALPSPLGMARPGSAVFRTLGNGVEAISFEGGEHQQEAGEEQMQQFAFSLQGVEGEGVCGGQAMQAEDSGVAWGQQEDQGGCEGQEQDGEGEYEPLSEEGGHEGEMIQHHLVEEQHLELQQQEAIEA